MRRRTDCRPAHRTRSPDDRTAGGLRILAASAPPGPATDRQAQTEERRPHGRHLSPFVGCSRSTAPVRLTGRPSSAPVRASRESTARPRPPVSCRRRHHPPSPRPMRCSGGEEARALPVQDTAPNGRPAIEPDPQLAILALAAAFAARGWRPAPAAASAAALKVVDRRRSRRGQHQQYIYNAKSYAAQARSYGARSSRSTAPMRRGPRSRPPPRAPTS